MLDQARYWNLNMNSNTVIFEMVELLELADEIKTLLPEKSLSETNITKEFILETLIDISGSDDSHSYFYDLAEELFSKEEFVNLNTVSIDFIISRATYLLRLKLFSIFGKQFYSMYYGFLSWIGKDICIYFTFENETGDVYEM
jgi:hypothetical protein